jgi:hypothetical protein
MLTLSDHDQELVKVVCAAIRAAIAQANTPGAVAKRIAVEAMKHRNSGRRAAILRHPFRGICEASGRRLDRKDAVLDEVDPARGYSGEVRWVCPKANNSGRRSCSGC